MESITKNLVSVSKEDVEFGIIEGNAAKLDLRLIVDLKQKLKKKVEAIRSSKRFQSVATVSAQEQFDSFKDLQRKRLSMKENEQSSPLQKKKSADTDFDDDELSGDIEVFVGADSQSSSFRSVVSSDETIEKS